ncbi:MAG: hypothetical protein ACYDER_08110 [Ktedonobacteraceae bacterium]
MVTQPDLYALAYPLFAPLPVPLVRHVYRGPSRTHPSARSQPRSLSILEQQIRMSRNAAYTVMHPFVASNTLTTSWLLKTLSTDTPGKVPVQTAHLALWHERHLLRYAERGYPDPDNAAALLVARMVDPRERNWLPPTMTEEEPAWWCWRQDQPDAPVVACPVPLPPDLPATALLWTPWLGASWQTPWLPVGTLGAIRFAGTRGPLHGEEWNWSLTADELRQWDPEIAAFALPRESSFFGPGQREPFFVRDVSQDLFHALVRVSLLRLALATHRLGLYFQSGPLDVASLGVELDSPEPPLEGF